MAWEIDDHTGEILNTHTYNGIKISSVYNPKFDIISLGDKKEIDKLKELYNIRQYLKKDI